MDKIPEYMIEYEGTFKYIQILVSDPEDKSKTKIVIRGDADCSYHKDIFRKFCDYMRENHPKEFEQFKFEVAGGGRIEVNSNHILVYGYSYGYGQADHAVTVEILKRNLGQFYNIEYSNDGY